MGRYLVLLGLAWILSSVGGCAASHIAPTVTTSNDAWYDDDPASLEVMRKLERPMDWNLEGVKFAAALDVWRNAAGVNVYVNWAALEVTGIEPDVPASIALGGQMRQVPAGVCLSLLLRDTDASSASEGVDWCVERGVVMVSTRRDLKKNTITRVYDIRDFLLDVPPAEMRSSATADPPAQKPSLERLFPGATREERIEQIRTLIQDAVGDQADWAAYGGEVSEFRVFTSQMVIKSTWRNHRQIDRLLADLRSRR